MEAGADSWKMPPLLPSRPLAMPAVLRSFKWLFKAALFLLLFVFALNNQHEATLHGLFGLRWQAPVALIVLLAFAAGLAAGVAAMWPGWRRARQE